MCDKDLATLLHEQEQQIIAERTKRLVERGIMVDPDITEENWKKKKQQYAVDVDEYDQRMGKLRSYQLKQPFIHSQELHEETMKQIMASKVELTLK